MLLHLKITNLNVFSSALPMEQIKRITEGEGCVEEGGYLAWKDMEWILHVQARLETVDKEEPYLKECPMLTSSTTVLHPIP